MANSFPPVTSFSQALHVRGTLDLEQPAVAVVGARAASQTAMTRAHAIARHLAHRGVNVVSGGALGIDGAAHRGALSGAGRTTVVLGTGIDIVYPARHAALFDQIVASGGALVSQFPLGTTPKRFTFVARNKVIATLASVTIVVEADVRSGSLSTATAARKLGRLVCAWPGSPGCDRLIGEGSGIVESVEDVDAALAGTPRKRDGRALVLTGDAKMIADAIASGARDIDSIISTTGLSVRQVLRALHARKQ